MRMWGRIFIIQWSLIFRELNIKNMAELYGAEQKQQDTAMAKQRPWNISWTGVFVSHHKWFCEMNKGLMGLRTRWNEHY